MGLTKSQRPDFKEGQGQPVLILLMCGPVPGAQWQHCDTIQDPKGRYLTVWPWEDCREGEEMASSLERLLWGTEVKGSTWLNSLRLLSCWHSGLHRCNTLSLLVQVPFQRPDEVLRQESHFVWMSVA